MRERFLNLFNQVFDAKGNVKPCGRNTCMELIEAAMELSPNSDKDYYGDANPLSSKHGYMDVQHIKALRDSIAQ